MLCALWQVGYAITKVPDDFHLHKGVKRVYDQRRQMIETGEGIDWGTAEALAFGTLLSEGGTPSLSLCNLARFCSQHFRFCSHCLGVQPSAHVAFVVSATYRDSAEGAIRFQ